MTSRKKTEQKIKDEPGAEQRFGRILKQALSTPPKKRPKSKKGEGKER